MGANIIATAFSGVMPYLAPLVFIAGAVMVAERLSGLIVTSFNMTGGNKRRINY